jgi:hypothetical protein
MILCKFEPTQPNEYRCTACGTAIISHTPNIYAACKQQPTGLGDWVKAGLSAIGITQERVAAVLGSCGGCPQRQEALNEFGRSIGIGRPDGTQEGQA